MKKVLSIVLILAMIFTLCVGCGQKQEEEFKYPNGSIIAICPYAAGGSTDIGLRGFLKHWEETLGTGFVVSNVTGGSGTVAATQLVTERNDGSVVGMCTLGNMVTSTFSVDVTYDLDSFEYIGAYMLLGFGMVVSQDSKYADFDAIVAAAKNETIKVVTCGDTETGIVKKINAAYGTKFEPVYYNSTTDGITDLIAGRVDALCTSEPSLANYIKAGQIKLVVALSATHWATAPDIPTMDDLGHPEVTTNSTHGIGVPVGVDSRIVDILRTTFLEAAKSDGWAKDAVELCNAAAFPMGGDEYKTFLQDMYKEMAASK